MQSRKVVDTSWLYSFFDEDDTHHSRAHRQSQQEGVYEVPSEILAETLALRYARTPKHKSRAASELCDTIMDAGFLIVGLGDPAPALELYRTRRSLSYPDCVAVVQARDAELLTFDGRQARAWRGLRRQ